MKFGRADLSACAGAILAHALRIEGLPVFKKGHLLSQSDIGLIGKSGVASLIVARLEPGDVLEDDAASQVSQLVANARHNNIAMSKAGTGRVNFHADKNGIFAAQRLLIDEINHVDPGITIATLADKSAVLEGRMVATVKIIPYAISQRSIDKLEQVVRQYKQPAIAVHEYTAMQVGLISTKLPTLKPQTIKKTADTLRTRLAPSGSSIVAHEIVDHDLQQLSTAIHQLIDTVDMIIVFGASAISDEADVIPAALLDSGGKIIRFGMPVDPGNLLLIGEVAHKPFIGAPGCARSPVENGFDHILNQLLAGLQVTSDAIAGMGVGGLLMEIGSRPQPREVISLEKPQIEAFVLAAGQSRRMGDINKLSQIVRGKAMVCHSVEAARDATIAKTTVITGHEALHITEILSAYGVSFAHNPDFSDGLSSSLRTAINQVDSSTTHALILLGDMPGINGDMLKAMISKIDKEQPNRIIIATCDGKRGNPVLWPRSYFEQLRSITGDMGARHIIEANREQVLEVELGSAAAMDIDTPEALEAVRKITS